MATNTMTPPLSVVSQIIPDLDSSAVDGAARPEDDRSSSLSEIGDRGGHDEPQNTFGDGMDEDDTEAETERLEDSPQKLRKHQNVVLTLADHMNEDQQSSELAQPLPLVLVGNGPHSDVDPMEPTSEISSPADSDEDIEKALSPTSLSPRKRKRSSSTHDSISDGDSLLEPSIKAAKLFESTSVGADPYPAESAEEEEEEDEEDREEEDQEAALDSATISVNPAHPKKYSENALSKPKYQKGKQKGKKVTNEGVANIRNGTLRVETPTGHEENQDAVLSNEEGEDNDEGGEIAEAENSIKTEEGLNQKRTALDSLNAMEKCFATLRDKLFDERLIQCNEELAMLESSTTIHPELVAMKEVIDQRRDQKLHYEQTLLRYRLQTLQRDSVANKAQAHSQYMQTVRELRDSHLEQLNENFYQLQRERRNVESDVPDYMLTYTTKRSQQIIQQTAYNTEVSLLAGIAKHVGFPAAPEIRKARVKEMEDDLRSMGITTQAPQVLLNHPPPLRAASSLNRQRSAADEQFMEQNPWANPQHPSHQQQRQHMHRQLSAMSRAATPSTTPAAQKRVVDLTEPRGSASTIPEHPSGPNSSLAATPATAEAPRPGQPSESRAGNSMLDQTPSRIPGGSLEITAPTRTPFEAAQEKTKPPSISKSDRNNSSLLVRTASQDNQMANSLPKPLPFVHTGGSSSTPAPRTTTPGRYTIIKAEDPINGARHSSLPRYNTPPVATIASSLANRFAA